MKRSASLILVELLIMLTVFAVAAAVCLRVFIWSDGTSKESAAKDLAWMQMQNAAETLKHYRGDFGLAAQDCGGQWDGNVWDISFDKNWKITQDEGVYFLRVVSLPQESCYLGKARLTVVDGEGSVLAELSVCWQEVLT